MKTIKYKGDYDFEINPTQGYVQNAIVHAVYLPLTPSKMHRYPKMMIGQVLRFWRFRAFQLSKVGLEGFEAPKNLQYIRNCPPVACRTNFQTRICTRQRVCPFCWARNVVVPAAKSVFNGWYFDLEPLSKPTLDIYRSQYVVDFKTVDEAFTHARKNRMRGVNKRNLQGGFTAVRISPSEEDSIRVFINAMVAVDRGSIPESTDKVIITPLSQLSRKNMSREVGITTKISQLMAEAEPHRVKEIVEAVKHFRSFSTFGNLIGMNPKPPKRTNRVDRKT